mgnify:CR=1 FL=1
MKNLYSFKYCSAIVCILFLISENTEANWIKNSDKKSNVSQEVISQNNQDNQNKKSGSSSGPLFF